MTVSIVPLGSEGSAANRYAQELLEAIRAGEALTPVELSPRTADSLDVIHVVASDVGAVTAEGIAPLRARCRALVLTWLPSALSPQPSALGPQQRAFDMVVFLTEADRLSAQLAGMDGAGAEVVPCAVPTPVGAWPPKSPGELLDVVLMWPNASDRLSLDEAIVAVAELPRGSTLTVAQDGSGASAHDARAPRSADPDSVERTIHEAAKRHGLADRVRTAKCGTEADIHALVARASAVIAPEPVCAGPWNGLTALAYGTPLLAADRTIYRDLMLRAGCVRIVRFDQPGHLAACLRALFGNELGLRELRERGAAYGETHNWQAAATRMAGVYTDALNAVSLRPMR